MAIFNGANNVVVNGGWFVANAGSSQSLNKLAAEVAPNAILNAGGRADEVRCFPGTREEVIGRLEVFMDDTSPDKKRMIWLSGPAGAGKSAICQTLAERRSAHGKQAANFFFFRGDSTRSHSKPLVATLVYQLCRLHLAFNEHVSDCLETDPLICSASIETQFKQLISSPVQTIQQSTPIQQQIVIIIDGLDECSDKRDQDQILVALHRLAHADHSPFLILVASRAEPHLVMSFNRLGSSVESMFLNDEYRPQQDIRLFVVAKFLEIKRDHHLARTLSTKWPTDADIDAITNKSSGQFIYAATVMRFIQFSSLSPALSLVAVLEMPPCTNHNPLAHLDAVYSYIFSKVHNIRAVKLILLARHCSNTKAARTVRLKYPFEGILQLEGYKDTKVQSVFADLAAIIHVVSSPRVDLIEFYHASLEDYLNEESRSTIYYIKENETAAELSSMCLRNIHDADSIQLTVLSLIWVQKPTVELSKSLLDASTRRLNGIRHIPYFVDLVHHIERLYWEYDKDQFKVLLQSWSRFVYMNNIEGAFLRRFQPKNPLASGDYEQYWMTEGCDEQEPLSPPDSAPAGVTKSNTEMIASKASANTAIGNPVHGLSVCKREASPGNAPTSPSPHKDPRKPTELDDSGSYKNTHPVPLMNAAPRPTDRVGAWAYSNGNPNYGIVRSGSSGALDSRYLPSNNGGGGDSLESKRKLDRAGTGTLQRPRKTAAGPARWYALLSLLQELFGSLRRKVMRCHFLFFIYKLLDSLRHKVTLRQPCRPRHAIEIHEGERGYGSREYDDHDSTYVLRVIRVKLHYHDDIRGMSLTPNAPFSEFINKVTGKLGKDFNDLIMKFKDEDGDKLTLRDDSDYELAVETAQETSNETAKGKLEIWCQDKR